MSKLKGLLLTEGMHGMISQVEGLAKALDLNYFHEKVELNSFWNLIPPNFTPVKKFIFKNKIDREFDINGKMEKIILMANKWMEISTSKNKKGDKVPRKYKLDYRSDGKLDITFIRMDKNFSQLHKWANNDITPFLYKKKGQTNNKKMYFNFADINSVDGGEAGVGFGSIFLRSKWIQTDKKKAAIALHELLHTQGMGTNCIPGIKNGHYTNRDTRTMLNSVDPNSPRIGKIYAHDIDMLSLIHI